MYDFIGIDWDLLERVLLGFGIPFFFLNISGHHDPRQ
jgi:hypothetical protein